MIDLEGHDQCRRDKPPLKRVPLGGTVTQASCFSWANQNFGLGQFYNWCLGLPCVVT